MASSALREDIGQIEEHGPFLEARWRELASFKEWRTAIAEEGVGEAAGKLVELTGAEVPGLGLALKAIRWGREKRGEQREIAQAVADSDTPCQIARRPRPDSGSVRFISHAVSYDIPFCACAEGAA